MKSESHLHDSPGEDQRLPLEILEALARRQACSIVVPPAVDEAILREAAARLAAGRRHKRPWVAVGLAAAACLTLMAALVRPKPSTPAASPLAEHSEEDVAAILLRECSALHPNQIKAIIRDEEGLRIELQESPTVPSGQALALRVCLPRGCKEIITFSGQHIEIAGHPVTVRAEEDGRVILDGGQFVWSSEREDVSVPGIQIKSRRL